MPKCTRRIDNLFSITDLNIAHKITWIAGKKRSRNNSKAELSVFLLFECLSTYLLRQCNVLSDLVLDWQTHLLAEHNLR